MKLVRNIALVALVVSAFAFSACNSGGACCDACGQGNPCECR